MEQEEATRQPLTPHAIQLIGLFVKELFFKAHDIPTPSTEIAPGNVRLSWTNFDYEPNDRSVSVALSAAIGMEAETTSPFSLRVEIVGEFRVDETRFPRERIEEWSRTNAVFILLPYMREHVFAISSRGGIAPILVPLVEIPTFQVVLPQ